MQVMEISSKDMVIIAAVVALTRHTYIKLRVVGR